MTIGMYLVCVCVCVGCVCVCVCVCVPTHCATHLLMDLGYVTCMMSVRIQKFRIPFLTTDRDEFRREMEMEWQGGETASFSLIKS
jgi:hypothetical protein